MTNAKQKSASSVVQLEIAPGKTPEQVRTGLGSAAAIVQRGSGDASQSGQCDLKAPNLKTLADGLRAPFAEVKAGDLGITLKLKLQLSTGQFEPLD